MRIGGEEEIDNPGMGAASLGKHDNSPTKHANSASRRIVETIAAKDRATAQGIQMRWITFREFYPALICALQQNGYRRAIRPPPLACLTAMAPPSLNPAFNAIKEMKVNRFALLAPVGALLIATNVLAQDPNAAVDKFRAAYTSGSGLAYVVIDTGKGEQVYRYGDASREAAKKDKRGFMLFTCARPHVYVTDSASDRDALAKAKVVKSGEPGFAQLDAKYLSGCKNPLVKSAVPKSK